MYPIFSTLSHKDLRPLNNVEVLFLPQPGKVIFLKYGKNKIFKGFVSQRRDP